MKSSDIRFTNGTSALEPDCSRYRNENEFIIDFGSASANWHAKSGNEKIRHACHVRTIDKLKATLAATIDGNSFINEIRMGGLEGTRFDIKDAGKMKVYGSAYTLLALIAIFFSM